MPVRNSWAVEECIQDKRYLWRQCVQVANRPGLEARRFWHEIGPQLRREESPRAASSLSTGEAGIPTVTLLLLLQLYGDVCFHYSCCYTVCVAYYDGYVSMGEPLMVATTILVDNDDSYIHHMRDGISAAVGASFFRQPRLIGDSGGGSTDRFCCCCCRCLRSRLLLLLRDRVLLWPAQRRISKTLPEG